MKTVCVLLDVCKQLLNRSELCKQATLQTVLTSQIAGTTFQFIKARL